MSLVLIVDDDIDVRESMCDVLKFEGHEVLMAANGNEAVKILESGVVPDVVFLDLLMPVMDGLEFLRHVIKYKLLPQSKIVVLSAHKNISVLPKSVVFLKKPFPLEDVLRHACH